MKKVFNIIIEIILYFIASLSFFAFIYIGLDMITGIYASGYRTIPAFVAYFLPTYILIVFHRINHSKNLDWMKKHQTINGFILSGLSLFIIILNIAYFAMGEYNAAIEGGVAPLYPLDTFLIAIISLLYGVYLIINARFTKEILFDFYPASNNKIERYLSYIMKGIGLGFSLYMTGALLWGIDAGYYDNPLFYAMFSLFTPMVTVMLLLGYDMYIESYPIFATKEKTKRIILICLSALTFAGLIATTVTYFVFPNIIIKVGQPYFRIDLIGNMNIAPYIVTIPPSLYCIYLWTLPLLKTK